MEEVLDKDCCLSPILFNLYTEYLTKDGPEGSGDFKIGQVVRNLKYGDNIVLQGMTESKLKLEDALK